MSYAGFYINLDRRADRRTEVEAELARHGVANAYTRFAAADGNSLNLSSTHLKSGEMGCFTSHYLLLKQNLHSTKPLHIIEDDVIFAPATVPVLNGIIKQNLFAGCDIVYTDVFVPVQNVAYKGYKAFYDQAVKRDDQGRITPNFSVVSLQGLTFGSTSSYLVNPSSIQKLHDLYEQEITNDPRQPPDLFIRRLCHEGTLKVGCLFPFVTSVRLDHILETDIVRDYHQKSALASHLARYSFFIGADLNECRKYIDAHLPLPPATDPHAKILSDLLAFSLTDNFRSL